MSGIFGFLLNDTQRSAEECLEALQSWNSAYGRELSDTVPLPRAGMGCCVEHLSDRIPLPPHAVLRTEHGKAVVDAVLYNREELAETLRAENPDAVSDEELLLRLIAEKGYDALAGVNGDFAGAIYEEESGTWTLFRDHLGIRPLFYYLDKDTFAFSTDMRGLAALPGAALRVNEEQLYLNLARFNSFSTVKTEYENIRCVPPASWLTVKQSAEGFSVESHAYWQLGKNKVRLPNDKAYQAELRRLITDAVRRRLDAVSGLVGAEFSGGWDSSVIGILIHRLGREARYVSWSRSLDDISLQPEDERQVILDICEQEHIQCEFIRPKREIAGAEINQALEQIAPPYLNTSDLGKGSAWLAGQGARVVFTGQGGDEGVSHRCNLYELWYHGEYFAFVRAMYRQTAGKKRRLLRTARRIYSTICKTGPDLRKVWHSGWNSEVFLKDDFKRRMDKTAVKRPLTFAYDPAEDIRQGGCRNRIDNVAVYGADNGVRYMLPFLDSRVIDYAVSIPRSQYENGYGDRWVYRQAFDDLVPQSLREVDYKDLPSERHIERGKADFSAIFQGTKDWVLQHLDEDYWAQYIDFDTLKNAALPENGTTEDKVAAIYAVNSLYDCAVMENMAKHASDRRNKHE